MEKYLINVSEYIIDEQLKGFEIAQKPTSSTVEYYGSNGKDTIFFQFTNGVSYLYRNVTKKDIAEMNNAESIGQFMSMLSRKYEFTKIKLQLVISKSANENQVKE